MLDEKIEFIRSSTGKIERVKIGDVCVDVDEPQVCIPNSIFSLLSI